jgi:hypothetical protein
VKCQQGNVSCSGFTKPAASQPGFFAKTRKTGPVLPVCQKLAGLQFKISKFGKYVKKTASFMMNFGVKKFTKRTIFYQ